MSEDQNKIVVAEMSKLIEYVKNLDDDEQQEDKDYKTLKREYVQACQRVLKTEWDKLVNEIRLIEERKS